MCKQMKLEMRDLVHICKCPNVHALIFLPVKVVRPLIANVNEWHLIWRITIRELADKASSIGSVHSIVTEDLGFSRISAQFHLEPIFHI